MGTASFTMAQCKNCHFAAAEGSRYCCVKCKRGEDHGKKCSQQPHLAWQNSFDISNCVNSTVTLQAVLPPSAPLLAPTKFPSTEHLFDASKWLGGRGALDESDSMLRDPKTRKLFLGGANVLVVEKLDGANLAVFFEPD